VESAQEICYSFRPSKNGCGLLATYPHLTTHHPRISFHQFPQTTFTHFQGTDCQHIALNLTTAHVHNIAKHHIETPNKRFQLELFKRGMREGSVVEDAIERNSWGKSRCEQMCCFPITGGLHRTSGDAPLDTPTLQHPSSILQAELITHGTREGSVVEDAVERNCWGKSRCEQLPNHWRTSPHIWRCAP